MYNYSNLPEHMRDSIRQYVEIGAPVGDFLTALLSNKLVETFGQADEINQASMFAWAKFLYSEVPKSCWGSPEAVAKWQEHKGLDTSLTPRKEPQ